MTRAFAVIMSAVFGLLFGSFYNCTAMRIVRGTDWIKERSRCPHCDHVLEAGDLIPVVSYLFLRGKCRTCGHPIGVRYPLTELIYAGIAVLIMLTGAPVAQLVRLFGLSGCLFVLALTDLEARRIPNGCLLAAIVLWLVTLPWLFEGWMSVGIHVAAMIFFAGVVLGLSLIMDRILKKDSMGGGDIKLIGVLALYLGFIGTMFMLVFASVLGILYAVFAGRFKRGQALAFGPFLAVSGMGMLLYGAPLVSWYAGWLTGV